MKTMRALVIATILGLSVSTVYAGVSLACSCTGDATPCACGSDCGCQAGNCNCIKK